MKRYLLTCACSHRVAVAPGLAGGAIRCPACHTELAVPRLGDLTRLELAAADASAPRVGAWNAARACLLAGCLVVLASVAVAGWLRMRQAAVAPLNEMAVRAAAATAPVAVIHASWLEFEREGLARPAVAEEQRRVRHARLLTTLEWIAWLAAALGLVIAVGGYLLAGRRRIPSSGAA